MKRLVKRKITDKKKHILICNIQINYYSKTKQKDKVKEWKKTKDRIKKLYK